MRVLSINAFQPNSAAAAVEDGKIIGAYYEQHLSRTLYDKVFPTNALARLKNPYKDYDKVVLSVPQTYKASVEKIKNITNASPTLVDHREALAMSAIITKRWKSCAVLVVDTYYTSIGYYVDGSFYWVKNYKYPNSLCLFYSAATRFLGYMPITEENKVEKLAKQGKPLFVDYILNNVLKLTDNNYELLVNLERGGGRGAANADIACSVQTVFEQAIALLAEQTKKLVDADKLVFVGKASTNVGAASIVSNLFEEVSTCCSEDAGASVLGAAALITDFISENYYLGVYDSSKTLADTYLKNLLKGEQVPFIEGKQAFSIKSLGTRSTISIPFIENVDNDSIAIVEEARFSELFESGLGNTTTYCALKKPIVPNVSKLRCLTVNSNSSPYLSRILKLTTTHGYPALVYKDLGSPIVNTCETYVRENNEI
jgi:predicted NodU family carbamoyl transferase